MVIDLSYHGGGFIFSENHFIFYSTVFSKYSKWEIKEFRDIKLEQRVFKTSYLKVRNITIGEYKYPFNGVPEGEGFIHKVIPEFKSKVVNKVIKKYEENKIEERKKSEEERVIKLNESKSKIIKVFDQDENGKIDLVDFDGLNLLLKKHEKYIIEIDRIYVKKFIKIINYLKTKKRNIQSMFDLIKEVPNQNKLTSYVEIIKDDIHSYTTILLSTLQTIVSIRGDDMIVFYEIYEEFDQLNIFDSQHEKDVSSKLTNIGSGIEKVMNEVKTMGEKINSSLGLLTFVTEQGNREIIKNLENVNSSLRFSNLLKSIQIYQNYRINQKLK